MSGAPGRSDTAAETALPSLTADAAESAARRRSVYALLIMLSLAGALGRIGAVHSDNGKTPFISANDRSRWCTIRALVEEGTYEIDNVTDEPGWGTIDKVRHAGPDGMPHYYSSKVPLLPTLLAGEYWVIHKITGRTLGEHPLYIGRLMLAITNGTLLVLFLWAVAAMAERCGMTDWGRIFVVAAAAFGTFVTTFASTLSNHMPAVACAALSMLAVVAVWRDGERNWYWFALAGLASAFTVVNELPALGFFCMAAGALLLKAPKQTLLFFLSPAALIAAGFFGTNYLAHQSLRPPYDHRGPGELLATVEGDFTDQLNAAAQLEAQQTESPALPGLPTPVPELDAAVAETQIELPAGYRINPRGEGLANQWIVRDANGLARMLLTFEGGQTTIHRWDHWYDYPGSHWREGNRGDIDTGEPSRLTYAFHVILGHHGIFSLTPIWLLALAGCVLALFDKQYRLQALALGIAALSAVCLAFYLSREQGDRNYGGATSCFRWMLWFAPLWLLAMVPAADRLSGSRWGRALALVLLMLSAASAAVTALHPWTNPWLYNYWRSLGWIG